jgi:3-oxoacyl-[acyl-carrier protein] reductase
VTRVLEGRRALVTGAASGIGHAIAIAYVEAGAIVTVADRDPRVTAVASAINARRGEILDATSESAVDAVVSRIVGDDGGLDVLVCAHGILPQSAAADMSAATWQDTIDVDLTAVFLLNRAALRPMLEQRRGRIINIASQLAIKGGVSLAHYAAAKAGVMALTRCAAVDLAPHGIRVNAVSPSLAMHPFLAKVTSDELLAELKQREAFGRAAEPWEVANVMVFLASDYASYMTGEVVAVSSQQS